MSNLPTPTSTTANPGSKPLLAWLFGTVNFTPLTVHQRRLRWGLLGLALSPIIGAILYNQGWRIPLTQCLFEAVFGIPCPGCGLTRSLMAIARLDWSQALIYHLFGPVLFGGCAIAVLHILVELTHKQAFSTRYTRLMGSWKFLSISTLLFLGYYALRLYARYGNGEMLTALQSIPLWDFLTAGAKLL